MSVALLRCALGVVSEEAAWQTSAAAAAAGTGVGCPAAGVSIDPVGVKHGPVNLSLASVTLLLGARIANVLLVHAVLDMTSLPLPTESEVDSVCDVAISSPAERNARLLLNPADLPAKEPARCLLNPSGSSAAAKGWAC